jgi:hypothetical protein
MSKVGSLLHYVMAKMYSNLALNNKYDCLKLHPIGYLIKYSETYFWKCVLTYQVKFKIICSCQIDLWTVPCHVMYYNN